MLGTILGRLGLPLLMKVVGGALGKIDNSVAQGAAQLLNDAQEAITQGSITPEQTIEANRHIERMAELEQEGNKNVLTQVNESLRAEVRSSDAYVRRMRPTFGYLMAVTWSVQMLALAYVLVFETDKAQVVFGAVNSLSAIWTVALSVLGIYVYKRSEEKVKVGDNGSNVPLPERKPS